MKNKILIYCIAVSSCFFLAGCKKDKKDYYSELAGKWTFNSIKVETIKNGVVDKAKLFDNTYEDNDLTIDPSGLYEARYLPVFMFNATYCFKGADDKNNHKGVWEFDSKKEALWFDKGITEYFGGTSDLKYSQKYNYKIEGNQLIVESAEPKIMADFGYNIGKYYFAGLWNTMSDDVYTEGESDGYRNGYWLGYYYGSPSEEETLLSKDAFYSYWATGVAYNIADTTGAWQYPNFKSGYESGYLTGYNDGLAEAGNVDWNANKTYKMTIVYKKL